MNTLAIPKFNLQHLLIGLFMLLAAGLAFVLTPKAKLADQGPRIDLETMIPKQFGEWRIDESIVPVQIDPQIQEVLAKTYSQTLSRTYVNNTGYRIMLSIAYGGTQTDDMNYHRPEVCYPAQGFSVISKTSATLELGDRTIKTQRLLTTRPPRTEPVMYWIVIGDLPTDYGWRRKLASVRYGLLGTIPDGLLFRVSSIDESIDVAYQRQTEFVRDLYKFLKEKERKRFFGAI